MEQPIYFPENQPTEQENAQLTELRNQNLNLSNALNSSSFSGNNFNQNLIEFQLEAEPYLMKLKHYLSGDTEVTDKEGNRYFEKQLNPQLIILNELGVGNYMGILAGFIGKETFLSVYPEERINEIIGDLGQLLRIETFSNASLYGLDNEYKITQFVLLVYRTCVFIENAYRRSIGGKEREGIRESRFVNQSQPLQGNYNPGTPLQMPKKKFSLFNKNSW
jgi:hypothetical protein